MLLDIKCSAVTSVAVHLVFDDNSTKDVTISLDDLIDVEYNSNGLRKQFQGKVIKINAVGTNPKSWSIIVDGSDNFESEQARFSPMSILDIAVIRKAGTIRNIESPLDISGIMAMRVVKGYLQYTQDGFNWEFVRAKGKSNHIMEEEGTAPDNGYHRHDFDEDIIKDEVS